MPSYSYVAINRVGKRIKDKVDSPSVEAAKNSLRAAGYSILEIKELGALDKDIDLPFLGNPTAKDMALFCRQFQSILRAGVPVSNVLSMLGQQTENTKLAAAIREMQAGIEKGETLAGSMRKHPKIFSSMLCNMIAAGEESGNLEEAFRQMEDYFDKAKKTKAAVGKAMVYPCVLIVVMIVVLIVMMTTIIPKFLATFTEMNMELPFLTQCVMAVSDWFVAWWWLIAIILVVLVVGGILFNRTNRGRHFFGFIVRKLPVVQNLVVRSECATFSRTLALLLGSGLSLSDSLDLVAANMNNIWFREAVLTSRAMVSEGWALNIALKDTGLFPPMVYNLVGIGEETGDLQGMLTKTADYYDDEVQDATANLLSLMEPCIILFLAVFVVIIVLSIFLPMMNMTKAYDQYL
ncbi:MAG: type II secretion system F family protein [Oscillospiraceae bacterium]|nr:type II secretion system F family protein [Oscillospiraceae bacterium]